MIHVSLECARLVSLCIRDLKRKRSWLLWAESVAAMVTYLRVRSRSTSGLVADRDWARIFWVLLRVVPVWPTGAAMNFTFPHKTLRAKVGVFGGLLLKLGMASEVHAEANLDKDEVALIAVEGGRVRRCGVR